MQVSLEAARVNAKMRQTDVALEMGVSRDTIGKWERGECFPDAVNFKKLCEIYHAPMDDIILPCQTT